MMRLEKIEISRKTLGGYCMGSVRDWIYIRFTMKNEYLKDEMVRFMKSMEKEKPKPMTAAERQAKAKAKLIAEGGAILKTVSLSKRANTTLNALCSDWGMTKTEVINKLLEEQEQRQLL